MGGTTGPPLNLTWPAPGTAGWQTQIDADFTAINAAIASLQSGGSTGPTGPTGPTGAVGMIYAGGWQISTAYVATDVVTYNGSSYIAIASNTGFEPDTNPNTWVPIALAGAAGPAGPTGPQGPPGQSGAGIVAYPIAIAQGGTGATTASTALAALGAAASGANSDITQLSGIQNGVNVVSISPTQISIGDGTVGVNISANGISMQGPIVAGTLQASGALLCGLITSAVPNSTITLGSAGGSTSIVVINNGLILEAAAPAVTAGQVGLGGTTASTATAGGGQAVPGTVLVYVDCTVNIGGTSTPGKIAVFAA
jgi:hypothetical protein